MDRNKMRVAILFGGKSGEHDVSLLSAVSVLRSIDLEKYEVIPVGIDAQGFWNIGVRSLSMLESKIDEASLRKIRDQIPKEEIVSSSEKYPTLHPGEVDVVFPVLHGTYGEDGTLQGLLEMLSLPYVGAGVLASSVGMDKIIMKKVLEAEGIPQGRYVSFPLKQIKENIESVITEIEGFFGYPCFIKPANLGSSVGISKASNRNELKKALELAGKYDRRIIVEEFINAREIEIAVLGNDDPEVSMPGEIIPENEFYDFEAKYTEGMLQTQIPANLSKEKIEEIRSLAAKAFKAIDGSGLSRIDFFVRKEDGHIFLNEINTMPGFTPLSMYPRLWEHLKIPYAELIDRLIQLALERYEEKINLVTKFEGSVANQPTK